MGRLTYEELRANTLSADTLKRLFEVIVDDRTAALAMFYVSIHNAEDDDKLEDIRKILKGQA